MGSPSQREERQSERPGKARRDYYSTNEITNESTNQKEGACNGPRDNQRNNNCNDNDDVYKIFWTVKRIEVERRAFSPHVKRPVIIIEKQQPPEETDGCQSLKSITSLGVQSRILHNCSSVSMVMFLFFFSASRVRLFRPCLRS